MKYRLQRSATFLVTLFASASILTAYPTTRVTANPLSSIGRMLIKRLPSSLDDAVVAGTRRSGTLLDDAARAGARRSGTSLDNAVRAARQSTLLGDAVVAGGQGGRAAVIELGNNHGLPEYFIRNAYDAAEESFMLHSASLQDHALINAIHQHTAQEVSSKASQQGITLTNEQIWAIAAIGTAGVIGYYYTSNR